MDACVGIYVSACDVKAYRCDFSRSGNLLLEDVELDPAQFDSLALPFTMTNGRVGRLEVSGVWSNVLKGTPVRIEIRDVEVDSP